MANRVDRQGARSSALLWAWWVLVSSASVALGVAAGEVVGEAVSLLAVVLVLAFVVSAPPGIASQLVGAVLGRTVPAAAGAPLGIVVGVAQWLVLRRHLPRSRRWITATATGFMLGWAVSLGGRDISGGVILGAVVGASQWLVLRRRVGRAGWWIVANAAGFAAASAANQPLSHSLEAMEHETLAASISGAAIGALSGAVTGGTLTWLLRRRRATWAPAEAHQANADEASRPALAESR